MAPGTVDGLSRHPLSFSLIASVHAFAHRKPILSLSRHHDSHGEMLKAAVCMVAGDPSRVPNDRHAKQRGMGCSFPNRVKDFADGHEPRLLAHLRSSSSFLPLIWTSYPLIKVCCIVWSCSHLHLILTTPQYQIVFQQHKLYSHIHAPVSSF